MGAGIFSRPLVRRAVVAALLLLLGPLGRQGRAEDKPDFSRWEKTIAAFEQQDKAKPPPKNAVLFVGSSSIVRWDVKKSFPDLDVINRGFGGSEIADSVHFAPRIIVPYEPRLIVFYAGDNDLAAGKTPERICADFRELVAITHKALPKAPRHGHPMLYARLKPAVLTTSS